MAETNTHTGALTVQVYTADGALPLANANVLITSNSGSGEELVRVLKTDRSGKTTPISLAAPPAVNSLDPENSNARFYRYNIRVDYPGYYTTENLNVPIFEGQTSIQPVAMIPLPADEERGKRITAVETEPNL
ncbi:MAG: carboxypeptidase regulatory-like domain-containing protein [Ruminococcaceae bacterium]|nr:carboxypeptidase regulatory-like domain-containing protein [Oscillospiraceae bacterium]